VVPDEYAGYRRPVQGALAVFLEGLPADHQATILADQASLPSTASAAERLAQLARSCPALHKLGQTLARDRRISTELRSHLQELESLPPSVPLASIEDVLLRELGPLDRLGVQIDPPALAEGSVAVVIPFRYVGGAERNGPRAGVFKVLKPGIEERLEQELQLLERVGSYLDEVCEELGIPQISYRQAFEQVREKLRHEVRLDLEQRHLALAHTTYADDARIHIPELFEHCTRRITAMERVYGRKVTDHDLRAAGDSQELAELVVAALLARPIFSKNGETLFHGDPHAGNLLLTDEHRLAILDWSLANALSEQQRIAFMQVMLGAVTLDTVRIASTLVDLAEPQRVDLPLLMSIVRGRLKHIRQGELPGLTWLTGLLDETVQKGSLRFDSDLLMLRKTVYALEGVITDIGAESHCVDTVLLSEFVTHLAYEFPYRWLAFPVSREFPTRLSNADLAELMLSFPLTATRYWLEQNLDVLYRSKDLGEFGTGQG
jgi:ubiquinone biosynthesis protein